MKFWKYLRWCSSAAFVALLLWSWWASDNAAPAAGGIPAPASTLTF